MDKTCFQKHKLNVRLTRRNKTLRQQLKRNEVGTTQLCSLANCKMRNKELCNRKNIIYKIHCNKCDQFYIGSTVRPLHARFKEHTTSPSSSVFKHIQTCKVQHSDINIDILAHDHYNTNLRLREAFIINKYKPTINSRTELDSYRDFLFY